MVSGCSDVSMSPKTNIICFWRHQDTPNNPRTNPNSFFENMILENLKFRKSDTLKMLEQLGIGNHEDPSLNFLNILKMGSISSRKHEMAVW